MHLVNVALCAIILSGPVLAQNYPGCKGGVYALIGKDISKYPPAQTYCSSKFPVPAQTSTILASTSTKTSTETAYTTTTGTVTVTTTYSTTTSTSTNVETNTQTDTATVTATVTRNAKRAANPTSDKWKSVLSQASSFIGAVCTCIENPKTTSVTTTPLATKTATSTNTVGATSTSTVSVVATTSTVTTSTTTTTITMTVTATVTAVPKPDYNECAENDFCSSQPYGTCYCYASPDGQGACYVNGGFCGQQGCNVNDDCPGSSICITECQFAGYAGGCSVDDQAIQCRTSQPSAKFLFARGSQLGKVRDRGVRDVNYLPYHEPPAQ